MFAQNERVQRIANQQIAGFSRQVTTLCKPVKRLQGHVNDLATDYGKLVKYHNRIPKDGGCCGGAELQYSGHRRSEARPEHRTATLRGNRGSPFGS